ncbi:hypothetical protein DIPPA_10464 [Diplonema papillatum]|nr:hypothetical protein DIPPA_10464 [Diplonema papillatum]
MAPDPSSRTTTSSAGQAVNVAESQLLPTGSHRHASCALHSHSASACSWQLKVTQMPPCHEHWAVCAACAPEQYVCLQ